MNLCSAMNNFLRNCNIANLSINTINFYKYALKSFITYANKHGISNVEQVNLSAISGYISTLRATKQPITIHDYIISLRIFFNYLVSEGVLNTNCLDNIKKPKVPQKVIYSFTPQEVMYILRLFNNTDFISYRNYTIMNILFGTGIRRSELTSLLLYDVDLQINCLRIVGKGNKERLVPISRSLRHIIKRYLVKRGEYLTKRDKVTSAFLINANGEQLTASGINRLFRIVRESNAKWSTRVSAHTFRHTFAKYYLLNGGDIFSLQRILGHSKIEVTRKYVDLTETEIKVQNEKFNPLDNTRWQYY